MVSLTAVETKLQAAFTEGACAVVAVPDRKKGEQLVLFTTDATLDRKRLTEGLKKEGAGELMIPRTILYLPEMPVLGSGKTDYVTLNRIAREKMPE
jgi:acyl-[acyl-carrier-protein]-phospholipid O-acyltransferase / long-chain-fatty-acid--[acyl-carrier-protein] ligase